LRKGRNDSTPAAVQTDRGRGARIEEVKTLLLQFSVGSFAVAPIPLVGALGTPGHSEVVDQLHAGLMDDALFLAGLSHVLYALAIALLVFGVAAGNSEQKE
jgi:hypothetical protein